VIQALPPKVIFTSEFFVDVILPRIVAVKPSGDSGRRLVLQLNNAPPHYARLAARNLQGNGITPSSQSAFSSDIAPSDFFLFSSLNGQLSDHIFESLDESVEAVCEIVSAIPRTTPERAFLEWDERMQRYIDFNGAYIDEN
jgi:hypothetical protein